MKGLLLVLGFWGFILSVYLIPKVVLSLLIVLFLVGVSLFLFYIGEEL